MILAERGTEAQPPETGPRRSREAADLPQTPQAEAAAAVASSDSLAVIFMISSFIEVHCNEGDQASNAQSGKEQRMGPIAEQLIHWDREPRHHNRFAPLQTCKVLDSEDRQTDENRWQKNE